MSTMSSSPLPIQVPPGAETVLTLSAGTVLHATAGQATLRPPLRWLAERGVAADTDLRAGAVLVVPESGVWGLRAGADGVSLFRRCNGVSVAGVPLWRMVYAHLWRFMRSR